MPEMKFEIKYSGDVIEVAGSVTTRLKVTFDVRIRTDFVRDASGNLVMGADNLPRTESFVHNFSYIQKVGGDVALNISARKKDNLLGRPYEKVLRHFQTRSFLISAAGVPLLVTPEFDLVFAFEAVLEGGFNCEVKGTMDLESGIVYHRDSLPQEGVWTGILNPSATTEGTIRPFYGSAKATATPLRIDGSISLWGIGTGAKLKLSLPKIEGEVRFEAFTDNASTGGGSGLTPASLKASLALYLSGSAGFESKPDDVVDLSAFEYTREMKFPVSEKTILPGSGNVEVN